MPSRYWGLPLLNGFARLKPGVTLDQARAEMNVLQRRFSAAHPYGDHSNLGAVMHVVPLKNHFIGDLRPLLWTLFGAVGFVLLIACANIASLLLARATGRTHEFAVRAALGAGRARLTRQMLVESLFLAIAGGTLGVLLAGWALRATAHVAVLSAFQPGQFRLNSVVLSFTLLLSIATGLLFGIFPSLQLSCPDLAASLGERGASSASPRRRLPLGLNPRGILVILQVALSVILLIGATLLMRSFVRLHSVSPGFVASHLLTAKLALPLARYDTDEKKMAFFRNLLPRLQQTPGVSDAALAMSLPTKTWIRTNILDIEGQTAPDAAQDSSYGVVESVTPGYFSTLRIPLLRGRLFNSRDNAAGASPVIILNQSLARHLCPGYPNGVNPVGRHVKEAYDKAAGWMEVVGIVADTHEGGLAFHTVPEFYIPFQIHPPQIAYLAVRTSEDPQRLASQLRRQILAVDPDQPLSEVETMDQILQATLGQRRLTLLLLASFAAVALLLTVVGIYGVIAYSVAQRTQELGVRRALGAQRGDLLRLVIGQGLALTFIGILLGIAGSLALTRVIKDLLFATSATDPLTFLGIAALFLVVALFAAYFPARRAARIDPMVALRVG